MSNQAFSNKTYSRAYAFKYIYRLFLEDFKAAKEDVSTDPKAFEASLEEFEESYIKEDEEHGDNTLSPSIQSYAHKLIKGYLENENTLVELISSKLQKRSYSSIGHIEKAILGLGAYELKHEDTPSNVVINEFINLNKSYGTKESVGFINGVLDNISKN